MALPAVATTLLTAAMSARQLILVRHAHAEWPDYRGRDFDRPLTPRGLEEAQATARAIRATGHRPELLLASAARRTGQTAGIIAAELQLPASAVRLIADLYNAPWQLLASEARAAATQGTPVLMVAHNPGVTELARALTDDPQAPPFKPADWRLLPL
jgi:phosphohistidine phosphatase